MSLQTSLPGLPRTVINFSIITSNVRGLCPIRVITKTRPASIEAFGVATNHAISFSNILSKVGSLSRYGLLVRVSHTGSIPMTTFEPPFWRRFFLLQQFQNAPKLPNIGDYAVRAYASVRSEERRVGKECTSP